MQPVRHRNRVARLKLRAPTDLVAFEVAVAGAEQLDGAMPQARFAGQQHDKLQPCIGASEDLLELQVGHCHFSRSIRAEFREGPETGWPGPDGPEYAPEFSVEGTAVAVGMTKGRVAFVGLVEITADSRDVASSNRCNGEMADAPVDGFGDSGIECERADDVRRNLRMAARC